MKTITINNREARERKRQRVTSIVICIVSLAAAVVVAADLFFWRA